MMRVGQIVQRVDAPEARAWSHTEGWKLAPWGVAAAYRARRR